MSKKKTDKSTHYMGKHTNIPLDVALSKNDTLIKPINDPDPMILRLREIERAKAKDVPYNGCPHYVSQLEQYWDDQGDVKRYGRPTNLWHCSMCNSILWLTDAYGNLANEG